MFLVETLTLEDKLVNSEIHDALEPKDIIYFSRETETPIFGVKLESSYYPGSAAVSGTVQIPARKALVWFLEQAGFDVIEVVDGWNKKNFDETFKTSHRKSATSILIFAEKHMATNPMDEIESFAAVSEQIFTFGVLSENCLARIEGQVSQNSEPYNIGLVKGLEEIALEQSPSAQMIISSIIHDPLTKTEFERAIYSALTKPKPENLHELRLFVTRLNSDWRSTYRALQLLKFLDTPNQRFWEVYAERIHPEFPSKMEICKLYKI